MWTDACRPVHLQVNWIRWVKVLGQQDGSRRRTGFFSPPATIFAGFQTVDSGWFLIRATHSEIV
jgi:hypothetical protein